MHEIINHIYSLNISEEAKADFISFYLSDEPSNNYYQDLERLFEKHNTPPIQREELVDILLQTTNNTRLNQETSENTPHHSSFDPLPESWHESFNSILSTENALEKHFPCPKDQIDLTENYLDLGKINKGGMGEIRRVLDKKFNRTLAMKIIHPHLSSQPRGIAKFIQEAQIIAQLQHPNIIPVYDIGKLPNGRYFYTMKEVKGMHLDYHIKMVHKAIQNERWKITAQGWTFRKLLIAFHQVCVGVGYAHRRRVIHRDLKPKNIMVGKYHDVLVMDWGISKLQDRLDIFQHMSKNNEDPWKQLLSRQSTRNITQTEQGAIIGTPAYMSPEQALGDNEFLTPRSDVFSLGAILYTIITGNPPYKGTDSLDIIKQIQAGPPPRFLDNVRPSDSLGYFKLNNYPHLPPIRDILLNICDLALQYTPQNRFANAMELADAVFWCLDD